MADSKPVASTARTSEGRLGFRPYWVVLLSVMIRAVHQVGSGVFLASFLLDEVSGPPGFYLLIAVTSGAALLMTEWMRHRQIYREFSGISTFAKLILLGTALHHYLPAAQTVLLAFCLAAVSSHLPKHIRHRLVI